MSDQRPSSTTLFLATVNAELAGLAPVLAAEGLLAHPDVATVRIAPTPALSVVRVDVDAEDSDTAGRRAGELVTSVIGDLDGTAVVHSHSAIREADR